MTFRTSDEDEGFRAELRDWLAGALRDQGAPPVAHDWAERRAYDVVHPTLGQRAADVPPKRVVDAELREYTAIANKQF